MSAQLLALFVHELGLDGAADRLAALATKDVPYAPGLPAPERAARVRELEQRIVALAREEEREASRLEREHADTLVVRRAGVDAALVLDVWNEADRQAPARLGRQLRE